VENQIEKIRRNTALVAKLKKFIKIKLKERGFTYETFESLTTIHIGRFFSEGENPSYCCVEHIARGLGFKNLEAFEKEMKERDNELTDDNNNPINTN